MILNDKWQFTSKENQKDIISKGNHKGNIKVIKTKKALQILGMKNDIETWITVYIAEMGER